MIARQGFTLMEILIVLFIIGLVAAFTLPNFNTPTEQATASNAQNNLLAIFSAEKNYFNNHSVFCLSSAPNATCADNLSDIDTNLSLTLQDDGKYFYQCITDASGFACMACTPESSNCLGNAIDLQFKLTNNPVQLNQSLANLNPTCTSLTGNSAWCP